MKIEKVNDHQIRCTLTKKELEKRDLKLSEIAYGNEKVKELFRDMMRMAAHQYGFEAEDIPLMIEVIPFAECAVIVVTKVEDPDELDTRFSKFAPSILKDNNATLSSALEEVFGSFNKSDNILDVIRKMHDEASSASDYEEDTDYEEEEETSLSARDIKSVRSNSKALSGKEFFYSFATLNEVLQVAHVIAPHYKSESALYKDERNGKYLLYLNQGEHSDTQFQSFCHLIEEYATRTPGNDFLKYFVEEHCTPMLQSEAIAQLAAL